jgi:hypothetical protein
MNECYVIIFYLTSHSSDDIKTPDTFAPFLVLAGASKLRMDKHFPAENNNRLSPAR